MTKHLRYDQFGNDKSFYTDDTATLGKVPPLQEGYVNPMWQTQESIVEAASIGAEILEATKPQKKPKERVVASYGKDGIFISRRAIEDPDEPILEVLKEIEQDGDLVA